MHNDDTTVGETTQTRVAAVAQAGTEPTAKVQARMKAEAKKKKISEINACVLKRPRHESIIKELNRLNVNINFITDGDIAGALSVIGQKPKNDIYYSTGGGPEGVIVAAALSCYGAQIQGR